jgi:hypothetical protein
MRIGINLSIASIPYNLFSPTSIFSASEAGVWFDPSDRSTLFQTSAGTTPVTAAGQPVGLILDKSKGLAIGPEVVDINALPTPTITNLSGSTGVWTAATRTMSNTTLSTSIFRPRFSFNFGLTIGATYQISGLLTGNPAGLINISTADPGGSNITFSTTTGIISGVFIATTTNVNFLLDGTKAVPNNVTISSLSIKMIAGNHATQSTAASRPTYQVDSSGKGYLLFDGVDDFLATTAFAANTNKMQLFAGVRKLSDAARGIVCEFSGGVSTNNGSFNLTAPDAAAANYAFTAKGTSAVTLTQAGLAAPVTNVITGLADIASPSTTLRVNGIQAGQSSATLGTGNFLSYILYIGRQGGTSNPANMRLYSLIERFGSNLSDGVVTQVEGWVNVRTGAY